MHGQRNIKLYNIHTAILLLAVLNPLVLAVQLK